ncbi:hypothetical protein ACQ4PT_060114 [Festuca glaucescens]
MLRSSPTTPSTRVPLPSPLERPARCCVGTAKPFRRPPTLRSSTTAVRLSAPGAGLPPPSPPASSAFGQVWTASSLRPPPPLSPSRRWPPYTGLTLSAPGTCVPPSPQASPPPGVMLERPARNRVGMAKPFLPPPALRSCSSAAAILPALGAGLPLPAPRSAFGQVGKARPPPSLWRVGPPYTGVTLTAPGACVPLSPQASPLPGVVLPPATEKVDEELQDATSPEGSRWEDTESVEEIMRMVKLTASEEDRRLDDDKEDQGNPSWAGAGLSQLASLQQANPMEPAKCLQLQRHRPQTVQPSNTAVMLSLPKASLLQLQSRLTLPRLFSRSFATDSGPPAKSKKTEKVVKFSPLSPQIAPASVQSHRFGVYTKLKEFEFGFMDPEHILATITGDANVINSQFDVNYLKRLYHEKFEDILVASGIFVDSSDETYLAALDAALCSAWEDVFHQKGPLYLTTLDVMRTVVALHPSKWRNLTDYLRDRKIIIIKRWDLSLGSVENMVYSHGFKPLGGRKLYRGQTDASFMKKLNRAALCGITWDDTQVFDCLICLGIACKSNVEAEMLSAVMILRRVHDLQIEDFMLHTDCSHVDGVLREEMVVKANSEHAELSRLLVGLKARFRNIFCQLEPREKLMFPDFLLRLERAKNLVFEEVLRIWSPHLLGLPIFRIKQKRHKVVKDLITKQASGGKLVLHHAYEVKVNDESSKLDGLRDVVMGMLPKNVEVLVRDKKEAILVKQELKKLFTKGTLVEFRKRKKKLGQGYEVAVMRRMGGSATHRTLRIIYHSSMEDVTVKRVENTISVKLVTPEDYDGNIQALRPECFLFFNGKPEVLLDIEKES